MSGRSAAKVDREERSSSEEKVIAALVGALLLAFVLVPAVIAVIAFLAVRTALSRTGRKVDKLVVGVVLAASLTVSGVLVRMGDAGAYGSWVGSRVGLGEVGWGDGPWPLILAVSAAMACVALLLDGSKAMRWLPRSVGRVKVAGPSLVPDAEERRRLDTIVATPRRPAPAPHQSVATSNQSLPPEQRHVPLGWDPRRQIVSLLVKELRTHALVLGATGSGKSVTLMTIAAGLADLGLSGMVLDHKEDTAPGGMRDFLRDYAHGHALEYQELCLSNADSPTWFNPISQMGPDEMRDTVLALMRFDDEYWQNLSKDLLTQLVNLLHYAHQVAPDQVPAPSLAEIGRLLKYGAQLPKATEKYRALVLGGLPGVDRSEFATIVSIAPDEAKNAVGFGSKITQLYNTQAGRAVLRGAEGKAELDVTSGGLVYVGLDNQGKQDLTKAISAAVLKKMSVFAAQRTTGVVRDRTPRFLIIDEASVVNREIVKDLLARARSAGIITILATQGPRDWVDQQGDDWSEMLQNINVQIIMRQNDPVSAEICAELLGQEERLEVSQRVVEGYAVKDGTMRSRLDYRVPPDQIRSLGQGEAVLRVGIPERHTFVKVFKREADG